MSKAWLWFLEKSDQLLLDVDDRKGRGRLALVERRIARANLKIKRYIVAPSNTKGNHHVAIELEERLDNVMRAAWRLRLGADIFHEAHNLKRISIYMSWPNLLIRRKKIPGWYEPDAICTCKEKHGSHPTCSVGELYRGSDTMDFFKDGAA